MLAYAIDVLVKCLRESFDLLPKPADLAIGHLIVLSQFAWPRYLKHFVHALNLIKCNFRRTAFSYVNFLDYVFNGDMLEEFMALAVSDELTIELKILGTGGAMKSKSMTTRGVNKNAKEEIRNALTNQIRLSKGDPDIDLFIRFIGTELATFSCVKVKEAPVMLRKSTRK